MPRMMMTCLLCIVIALVLGLFSVSDSAVVAAARQHWQPNDLVLDLDIRTDKKSVRLYGESLDFMLGIMNESSTALRLDLSRVAYRYEFTSPDPSDEEGLRRFFERGILDIVYGVVQSPLVRLRPKGSAGENVLVLEPGEHFGRAVSYSPDSDGQLKVTFGYLDEAAAVHGSADAPETGGVEDRERVEEPLFIVKKTLVMTVTKERFDFAGALRGLATGKDVVRRRQAAAALRRLAAGEKRRPVIIHALMKAMNEDRDKKVRQLAEESLESIRRDFNRQAEAKTGNEAERPEEPIGAWAQRMIDSSDGVLEEYEAVVGTSSFRAP